MANFYWHLSTSQISGGLANRRMTVVCNSGSNSIGWLKKCNCPAMSFKESAYQMHSAFKPIHYGSHMKPLRNECKRQLQHCAFAPQPNWGFNADTKLV